MINVGILLLPFLALVICREFADEDEKRSPLRGG
jgi:hypothetical protein